MYILLVIISFMHATGVADLLLVLLVPLVRPAQLDHRMRRGIRKMAGRAYPMQYSAIALKK